MTPKALPRNEALLEEMTTYSLANYVKDMMAVMMERIIVEQPNDPLSFLIDVVQNDPRILAMDEAARFGRMDLRCVATKKRLLRTIFVDMGGDAPKAAFRGQLLASAGLRSHFPRHANDIANAFVQREPELPPRIAFADFAAIAMAVLSRPGN
ncbi:hypothetical protein ACHHYP_01045 [Achlya hypogyna]|uniref:Uncharacterized protein n=1 Tax=Achlya hypogyna TaxID=1202772 RepID=A0A1V9ZUH0_ACHHY|nr:hypothetical protein ACHHYP_01045 [Achlya hypogyna]